MAFARSQPQGQARLASDNSLSRGLVLAMQAGSGLIDVISGIPCNARGTATSIKALSGGLVYDQRTVNTGAFLPAKVQAPQLVLEHTLLLDVVINGAPSGTIPAIGGLWRSATQNDVLLAIERDNTSGTPNDVLNVAIGYGSVANTRASRTGTVPQAAVLGKRLSIAASISRSSSGVVGTLRVASAGVLLYEFPFTVPVAGASTIAATGAEYFSLGSETVENPTRNSNTTLFGEYHYSRQLTADEVVSHSANPWQMFAAKEDDDDLLTAGSVGPLPVSGTFGATNAAPSMSAAGAVVNAGTFGATMAAPTFSASGVAASSPVGSFAALMPAPTLSATGIATNSAQFAATMAAPTMAATGTAAPHATGAFAATMPAPTFMAYGNDGSAEEAAPARRYRWRILRRYIAN